MEKLKWFHWLILFLIIPYCLFLIIGFGDSLLATVFNRPGMSGMMYYYYQLSKIEFILYNFFVVFVSSILIIYQVKFSYTVQLKKLHLTFLLFIVFVLLLIIFEYSLSTRLLHK